MIEIKTFPENDVIYIDFAYKGIPEDLSIEKIVIRTKPDSSKDDEGEEAKEQHEEEAKEGEDEEDKDDDIKIKDIILDADDIQIGADLDEIVQIVDVAED